MASATSRPELDEIDRLEQRIVAIRKEIQSLTAEALATGANLPVLRRKRKEKLQAELSNLLQKLRLLKQQASQPKQPVDGYSTCTSVSPLLHAQAFATCWQYI